MSRIILVDPEHVAASMAPAPNLLFVDCRKCYKL
jgi:hypothetical protein